MYICPEQIYEESSYEKIEGTRELSKWEFDDGNTDGDIQV